MFSRLAAASTRKLLASATTKTPSLRSVQIANPQNFSTSAAADNKSGFTSVKDLVVNITIVDPNGARKKIKGIVGKTLYDCCEWHGIRLGPASVGGKNATKRTETWTEPTFGEGANGGFDHVVITGKGVDLVEPPQRPELFSLEDYWDEDELFEGSRLASCVVVNKEMDGMVVFVPERKDFFIP